jgi:Zn-dependent protease with chaperone function
MPTGWRRMGRFRSGVVWACVAALVGAVVVLGHAPAEAIKYPTTADEVKFGAQIDKQIETHYRLVTDPGQVDRVTTVGNTVARVVERQDLTYHFLIVQSPAVNSFAVPGGWVYITEGMMQFVRTDDELAAVLAHELAHINHRDYYIEQDRQEHLTPEMWAALAVSILAQSPGPLMAMEYGIQGAMSSYQQDLERNADLTGVAYLTKTSYSPVAMLTLLEHLAQTDQLSGQNALNGSFQDHPSGNLRVAYVGQDLVKLGIPIIRRPAEGYLRISLDPASAAGAQPVTIRVDGRPVLTLGAVVGGAAPLQRAQAVVDQMNAFFNTDPAPYDVHVSNLLGNSDVIGAQTVLYRVAPEDATYAHVSADALAGEIRAQLAAAISNAPYNRRF